MSSFPPDPSSTDHLGRPASATDAPPPPTPGSGDADDRSAGIVQPVTPVTPTGRRARPSWALLAVFTIVAFFGGALVDRASMTLTGPATAQVPTPTAVADTSPGSSAAPKGDDAFALIRQAWDLLHQKYVGKADLDD